MSSDGSGASTRTLQNAQHCRRSVARRMTRGRADTQMRQNRWSVRTRRQLLLATAGVMVACTSSSRGGPVPRSGSELSSFVAEAPAIAQQACDKWASIWHGDTGAAPPLADVNSVESVANYATNHDLEFVVLRDHVHFVATAITNGDVGALA